MIIHTVTQGDTLWKLAKTYGVSPKRIQSDNAISDPNRLVVGQSLLILLPDTIHTVRPGDTLTRIANQYGTDVTAILQNNPSLSLNTNLYPGEQLTISFQGEKTRNILINGYAYPYINKNVLRQTLPYLSMLTIFGYGVSAGGTLIEIDDQPLIELTRRYRVAPIMLLSSVTEDGTFSGERASRLFQDLALQNAVIAEIIQTMKQKGYYGLDVDFEYVNQEDSEAYLEFLRNITRQLHQEGFRVNVDLAPKTSATQPGLLYEAHDYAAIGAIADTVLLMTYEWGYTYGPPMAVAPVDKVRQVVEYAVTEIPVSKLLMGVPNYGYDWTLPYMRGETRATSIGNQQAIQIATRNNAQIQFDEAAQSPYFRYWDSNRREHIVWFEDVRSILAKMNLISEFDLLGAGYWNVMRPFIQNWLLVSNLFRITKLIP